MPEDGVEQTLYQCSRCTVQWAGPETDDDRLCECGDSGLRGDVALEAVGTVETDESGWQRLGPAAEVLQPGFGVRYESDRIRRDGAFMDWDTQDDPVPGQILNVEETRFGPRYEVSPNTEWWFPEEGIDEPAPTEHCWHWEIVEVTERTRASVRMEEIRRDLDDDDDGLRADGSGKPADGMDRTPLAGRNLIECHECGDEIVSDELARTVKWGFWDAETQNFERAPHHEHYCEKCWREEWDRDAAAHYEVEDAERFWNVLEAADGRLVADLRPIFVGGRPWIRVVDGELQALNSTVVDNYRREDGKIVIEHGTEEADVDREWFDEVFRTEKELPDDAMPTLVLLKPADETPFDEWEQLPDGQQQLVSDGGQAAGGVEHPEVGESISVSERQTPMEVTAVTELQVGTVVVEAKNHHGRYTLKYHGDGSISFRAGGRIVSGDVEVERHV